MLVWPPATAPAGMKSVHSQRYGQLLVRLREARREADLTQVEVAEALGRPQSFVSKCESGERRIDVIELEEYAALYRKPIAYFLKAPPVRRVGPKREGAQRLGPTAANVVRERPVEKYKRRAKTAKAPKARRPSGRPGEGGRR